MLQNVPCDVPKFDGRDFPRWQNRMVLYLRVAELWDVVGLPIPDVRDPEWSRLNYKALGIIFNRCSDEQQDLIDGCETAKEAWDTLVRLFSQPSPAMLYKLWNDINNIRKSPSEDIAHYVARCKSTARTIRAAGEPCSDNLVINRLLAGLPSDYDHIKVSIFILRDFDLEDLTKALLGAEARLASRSRHSRSPSPRRSTPQDSSSYRSRDPLPAVPYPFREPSRTPDDRHGPPFRPTFPPRCCTHCGRSGHLINDCWMLYPERGRYFPI